jgi:predicted acetyltransferase
MDRFEIRPLREEEFADALWVASMAFGEHQTPEDQIYYKKGFDFERSMCAFEKGKLVDTSTTLSLELTLPGGNALPIGGLTWIAVLPTHRRQGIMRQLIAAQLQDMVGRGEPASALFASEGNIYGRFGYGPATSVMSFQVPRDHAVFLEPVRQRGSTVLLRPEEAAAELPAIYENLRLLQPGAISRPGSWWEEYLHDPEHHREGAGAMIHAKHETQPGIADGYVTYRIRDDWPPPRTLQASCAWWR